MTVITRSIPSPLGNLLLVGDGDRLSGLFMTRQRHMPAFDGAAEDDHGFDEAVRQLGEWFDGRRQAFDLKLMPRGSVFQLQVWDALREIPFGQTMTYGEVARRVGRPGSARAIGHAVGRNPIGIVIPCHRVMGASGALTGYAAGVDRKRWLLDHEQRLAGASADDAAAQLFPPPASTVAGGGR